MLANSATGLASPMGLLAAVEVRRAWTQLVGRAKERLRNTFEIELPPILSGLDATAIQEESRRAIDEVLAGLNSGP